jgi:hypothetical protein
MASSLEIRSLQLKVDQLSAQVRQMLADQSLLRNATTHVRAPAIAKGEPGLRGFPGVKGDKGDKGEQGIQGIQGTRGLPGPQGTSGVSTSNPSDPETYGADPTGVLDSAPALRKALSVSPYAKFGKGKFKLSSAVLYTLPSSVASVRIDGAGPDLTEIYAPNNDALQLALQGSGSSFHLRDFSLTSGQLGAGRKGVSVTCTNPIPNPGLGAVSDVSNVVFRGSDGYVAGNYWDTAFEDVGVSNIQFNNCGWFGGSSGVSGLYGAGKAISCVGLPAQSSYAVALTFRGCTWDQLDTAFDMGSYTQGFSFVGCNISSCNYGAKAVGGLTGLLAELQFIGGQIQAKYPISIGTSMYGLNVLGTQLFVIDGGAGIGGILTHAHITDSVIVPVINGTGTTGIDVLSGSDQVHIRGCELNNFSGAGGIGVNFHSGSSVVFMSGTSFVNNATNVIDNSTSGRIRDCPGYNPVATLGPYNVTQFVGGGSPTTVASGSSPMTVYFNQNATNTATVRKNGVLLHTMKDPNTWYPVHLDPRETLSVTWATTQPLMVWDIH